MFSITQRQLLRDFFDKTRPARRIRSTFDRQRWNLFDRVYQDLVQQLHRDLVSRDSPQLNSKAGRQIIQNRNSSLTHLLNLSIEYENPCRQDECTNCSYTAGDQKDDTRESRIRCNRSVQHFAGTQRVEGPSDGREVENRWTTRLRTPDESHGNSSC